MMNDLQTLLNPSQNDINEIEEWLEVEYRTTKKGFYTDRDVLAHSFSDKNLIILKQQGKVVSFIAWKCYIDNTVKISIAETHPDFRRHGLIRLLLDALISNFQKSGILVIDLHSISQESEAAWKHLGFNEFPEDTDDGQSGEKELYKIIIPVSETGGIAANETLELWHMGDHQISNAGPNVIWNLSFIDGSRNLQKPIVYPAHYDWYMCWKRDGVLKYDGKVKRFPAPIYFGRFMIVGTLPD